MGLAAFVVAFAIAEIMRGVAIPLAAAGFALIIIGAMSHGLSRRGHGEV